MSDEVKAADVTSTDAALEQSPVPMTEADLDAVSGGGAKEDFEAERAKAYEAARKFWGPLASIIVPRYTPPG